MSPVDYTGDIIVEAPVPHQRIKRTPVKGVLFSRTPDTGLVVYWVQVKGVFMDPSPVLTELVTEWYNLKKEIEAFKVKTEREMTLRKMISSLVFPQPAEGVNTSELPAGWQLKMTYKIDRKVDEAALEAVIIELQKMLVNTDGLIRRKPELALTNYRQLTEEQRKVMDQALESKPASPTLELIPPKGM